MIKRTLVSIAVVSFLSACGGSSGGSSTTVDNTLPDTSTPTPTPTPSDNAYKVIDGYLVNAEVCVIKVGETNCEVVGMTDEQGSITLANDLTEGQVIATITAGKSQDTDNVGFVAQSYQMIANISADTPNVITPFTTLDVLDESKSMADIAAELSLPESVISGDYIASTESEQAHTHALAKGIVSQLNSDVNANDVDGLTQSANAINEYIVTTLANSDVDLNNVNVYMNNNSVTHTGSVYQLSDFLEQGNIYVASFSNYQFTDEGVNTATFSDGNSTFNGSAGTYSIDGDLLKFGNESEGDKFLYVSSLLSLSVPLSAKDLTAMSSVAFSNDGTHAHWQASELVGKSYYNIFDDAPEYQREPEPTLVKMTFSKDSVEIIEGDESFSTTWHIDNGKLVIDLLTSGIGHRNLSFFKAAQDQHITIVRDSQYDTTPSLFVTDESLAYSLFDRWMAL